MLTLSRHAMPFLRHIHSCRNITLPAGRIPLLFQNMIIGYVVSELKEILQEDIFHPYLSFIPNPLQIVLHQGESLRIISKILEEKNIFKPFNEWFDVRLPHPPHAQSNEETIIIGQIDRALIPLFGTEAEGVHLNGLVYKDKKTYLWVAERSQTKRLDPGKFDHLVAGGICAGLSAENTLIKEALEEAQLNEELTKNAQKTSSIRYAMLRSEGLRRDRLHCYDLILPEDFLPYAADGEVERFILLPIEEVFQLVRDTDKFKFNVNLVLIDLFIRLNLFNDDDGRILHHALFSSPPCIEQNKTT